MIYSKDTGYDPLITYLKNDGIFISSGIIHAKIDEVVQSLEKAGFEILEVEKKGEWACVIAK